MRKPKVIVLSAVFPPEPVVSAKTSYSLAVGLVQRHHSVKVVTNFPNRPAGTIYQGYKRSLYSTCNDQAGFRLVRCFSFFSKKSTMLNRWLEHISFGLTSSLSLLFSTRPDAVYSNSWPVFATGLTCLVCKMRHIPLVISIQDMYPESLVIQGHVKPGQWLYRFLLSIDKWIAKYAASIIVLSESHARLYSQIRAVLPSKIRVIPNWVDQNSIVLMDKNDYRNEAGISPGAFVFVYGGNIGKAAGVETIIEAMKKFRSDKEVVLIVAGSGSELTNCQKAAVEVDHARILFHTPWKPEETSRVLAAADVLILPTRGTQSLVSVPSKLLSYLLASKPVLAMVLPKSDTAKVIEDAGCGWVVPPENSELLVEKLLDIANTPLVLLVEIGQAGRDYALDHFTTEKSLPILIDILENASR